MIQISKGTKLLLVVSIVAGLLGVSALVFTVLTKDQLTDRSDRRYEQRTEQLADLRSDLDTVEGNAITVKQLLEAQREQFQRCVENPKASGCSQPVSPPSAELPKVTSGEAESTGSKVIPIPGKDGARGSQGPGPSDQQIDAGIQRYLTPTLLLSLFDQYCADGKCKGEKGDSIKGEKGDSVKGDTGDTGPAGPTCPEGWRQEEVTVLTDSGPEEILVCRANQSGPVDPTPQPEGE